jgi:hypothetical protein
MASASEVDTQSMSLGKTKSYIKNKVQLSMKENKNGGKTSALWLAGPAGIGKSDIFEQICIDEKWGLSVQYMATLMLEQITGLPNITDKNSMFTKWTCPEIFNMSYLRVKPKDMDKDPILLFLDDAHLCNKSVQAYMFQLFTYRALHSHKLPKNIVIVLAGNRSEDKAGFQQILAPISNRLYFINVKADADDWVSNFAIKNEIRPHTISAVQHYPNWLLKEPLESGPWTSPRSLTYMANELDYLQNSVNRDLTREELTIIAVGHLGPEVGKEYVKFETTLVKWEPEKILKGIKQVTVKNLNRTECYTLLSALVNEVLRTLRLSKYKVDKPIDSMLKIFTKIILDISKTAQEIIPLGLKILILGERNDNKKKVIVTTRLLKEKKLINLVTDLL